MNNNSPSIEVLDTHDPVLSQDHPVPHHPHRHHHSNKKVISLCVILLLLSLCFTPFSDRTFLQKYAYKVIDQQEYEVTQVTLAAAGLSALVALVPDDSTTPVADQIAGICSKLTYVLVVLLFERLLLSFTGLVSFGFLLPASFISFIIHQKKGNPFARKLGARLLVLGIIFYSLIPASAFICTHVNRSLELGNRIENIQSEVSNLDSENSEDEGWLDSAIGVVRDTLNKISSSITGYLNVLKHIMDVVAGMILTDIVIPVFVLFIYKWLLQKFIEMYLIIQR